MPELSPVVIGGNGHSGTRVFLEIIGHAGLRCGVPFLTQRRDSEDLRILGLLNRWARPYLYRELDAEATGRMKQAFARRLRLYFPFRGKPWGFKNPRCMLILPVLHELFPDMKFVHVIRDGRDISLGNQFVSRNEYVDAFLEPDESSLPPEQKMILFWGRSNQRAHEYGKVAMGDRYRLIRWEDLCSDRSRVTADLIRFAGGDFSAAPGASRLVRTPGSMGRWQAFPEQVRDPVNHRGAPWLELFGYA